MKLNRYFYLIFIISLFFYLWLGNLTTVKTSLIAPAKGIEFYNLGFTNPAQITAAQPSYSRGCLDFQDSVEKIYRQLANLRINQARKSTKIENLQPKSSLTLNVVDKFKLVELRKSLDKNCDLPTIDRNTAVFRSIMLKDGIAIVLILPDADSITLKMHWIPIPKKAAIQTINELRLSLEKLSDRQNNYQEIAREVYNWFIRPFARELEQIKTLVFVQDGILWTIPMAILFDGKHFLVEKYAIANTPSLSLNNLQPLNHKALKILAFGLTNPSAINQNTFFPPLSGVKAEMQGIRKAIPYSKIFLNQKFTSGNLKQKLQKHHKANILHLATHARFNYNSQETFLVTGEKKGSTKNNPDNINLNPQQRIPKYNKTISLGELYKIIKTTYSHDDKVLDILTLTGCQTAIGIRRDAVLIAGLSLQPGVRSIVASLWNINDGATARLIVDFYDNLRQGMSKAEALQAAQKTWLVRNSTGRYSHPGYWAPFILVGDWL